MVAEVILEFMTGNPQLGVLSGRLAYYLDADNDSKDAKNAVANVNWTDDSTGVTVYPAGPTSGSTSSSKYLPDRRSTLLCILSVPAHMIPTDILQFVAPMKKHVYSVRILRPCNPVGPSDPERTPVEYMVLLQMESQDSADELFLQCNGKRFNSFEDARCRVVFVATATFDLRAAAAAAAAATSGVTASAVTAIPTPAFDTSSPSPGTIASANCASPEVPIPVVAIDPPVSPRHIAASSMKFTPVARSSLTGGAGAGAATVDTSVGVGVVSSSASGVGVGMKAAEVAAASALEHDAATCVICMDRMESQVLTTVCNHSFHVECLMKWQDSPCPVCRFHHNNASEASTCQECQATDNVWVCLICGSVLCGSRHEDHVRLHYTNTLHAYALEIETQQVWDFAGDGFVHRLIHNKADGKLVEIPDPGQTSEERPQVPARLSDVQEERLVHGKLEGLAYQYNTLLTSQLDEQRHFYQKRLDDILEQQEKDRHERREKMISGGDLISALRQEKRELESKCTSVSDRLKKVREETAFLWELNKSLETNKEQWSASLEQAQRDLDDAKTAREQGVPQLEEKVAQLMHKLDAAATSGVTGVLASAGVREEGEGGGGGSSSSTGTSSASCTISSKNNGVGREGGVPPGTVAEKDGSMKAGEGRAGGEVLGNETMARPIVAEGKGGLKAWDAEGGGRLGGGDAGGEGRERRDSTGASLLTGQQGYGGGSGGGGSGGGSGKKKGRRKKGR